MCLALGFPHPDHLEAVLSLRQIEEWAWYYELEPWGEERADMRMARQVWATLQPHSRRTLREQAYLFRFEPPKPPTPDDYRRKSMRAYLAQGGKRGEDHQ